MIRYREQIRSRTICFVRKQGKNFQKVMKKIKKVWKNREQYISKDYVRDTFKKESREIKNSNINEECVQEKSNYQEELQVSRVAVYTCIFGDYDKVNKPFFKSKYCDYYIVTDQDISDNSGWKKILPHTIPKDFEKWHPAIKNRYYKMHPQDIFREHKYSLYIDGNIQPMADLYPFIERMKEKRAIIGMFNHPIFNCLYDAAEHLKSIDLVDESEMDFQTARYREEGFPDAYGFFECNLIAREHNMLLCQKLMETWWEEYSRGVKRDQQSFTYALWKNGIEIASVCTFGRNIRENIRIKLTNHKRNHEKVRV